MGDVGDEAALRFDVPAPFTAGELWVRTYVLVPSTYGGGTSAALAYLEEPTPPNQYIDATITGDSVSVYRSGTMPEVFVEVAASLTDAWHCFEWHIVLGAGGTLDLFIDGDLLVSSGPQNLSVDGAYDAVNIGQSEPFDTPPSDALYLDQVVISSTRPGCDPDVPAP